MTSQAYCKFMEIICTYPQLLTSNDGMLRFFLIKTKKLNATEFQ